MLKERILTLSLLLPLEQFGQRGRKANMAKYKVMRRQKPIPGGREALPACVLKEIRRAVEKEAMRHGVSKSFVIAVALAKAFGIKDQEEL